MSSPSVSAVLLAGGASRRMGSDKCALAFAGQPLWQHQLHTLARLKPAELFISGPTEGAWCRQGHTVLPDPIPGRGPLGGLAVALQHCRTAWLAVLAVDLPLMPAAGFGALLARAEATGRGQLPFRPPRFEPLAAIYPRAALGPALDALAHGPLALQDFCHLLVEQGHADAWPYPDEAEFWFRNANTPDEWRSITAEADVSRWARPASSDQ